MSIDAISGASGYNPMYSPMMNDTVMNDSCFWKAYNYNPVADSAAFRGAVDTAQVQDTTTVPTSVQGSDVSAETKSKSPASAIITGGLFVAGAASVIAAASKGNGKGLAKVADGYKQMWRWCKEKLGFAVQKGKPTEFTIRKEGENTVCTLSNRLNRMRGKNAADELGKIGSSAEAPGLTGDLIANGIKARAYEFEYDGLKYVVRKGKIVGFMHEGKLQKFSTENIEKLPEEVKNKVAEYEKGNNWDELLNLEFAHRENGVSRLFTRADKDSTVKLKCAVTDRFNAGSDAVVAYAEKHGKAKEKLEAFAKNELDNLKVAKGEYYSDTVDGTFIIENNAVTGIKIDGTVYPANSDKFIKLQGENKELFEKVMEHKKDFTNVIYK